MQLIIISMLYDIHDERGEKDFMNKDYVFTFTYCPSRRSLNRWAIISLITYILIAGQCNDVSCTCMKVLMMYMILKHEQGV